MAEVLRDQVCLVTGAAQGIGWAICQAMAEQGALVYACDVSSEYLNRALHEVSSRGWHDQVHLTLCDVAERDAIEGWIDHVWRDAGRIDVLVNNAAFIRWDDVVSMPVEDMQRIMDVCYGGMIFATKAVLPKMQAAGRGHIINMGSVAGQMFLFSGYGAYAAAKAAIAAYTQILQVELRTSPIAVTLVQPGIVSGTDMFGRQVDPSRLPRAADFLPTASPDLVARCVLEAIRQRKTIVTVPWVYKILYAAYAMAPRLSRWLVRCGKSGRRTYGRIQHNNRT